MADYTNDWDYHIKYPLTECNDNDNFLFASGGRRSPVVILFGWAGCQDKYLAKYSAIYEEKGCITFRCTTSTLVTFLRHDKLPILGEKVLDLLKKNSLDQHPIFFHIFSNGGAFFYQHVSLQMQKKNLRLDVKGVIFDSAPGEKRFCSVFRALSTIIGGSAVYNVPVSLLITTFLFAIFIMWAVLKGLLALERPQTDPIKLAEEPYSWPQLFIYSKDDELVKYQDIEKFAVKRERKGVKVERLRINSSPHVQHLLKYREFYINTVVTFMQKCMEDNKLCN